MTELLYKGYFITKAFCSFGTKRKEIFDFKDKNYYVSDKKINTQEISIFIANGIQISEEYLVDDIYSFEFFDDSLAECKAYIDIITHNK